MNLQNNMIGNVFICPRHGGFNGNTGYVPCLVELQEATRFEQTQQLLDDLGWPRCDCGGIAVTNASGDITRTCIRCGKIVRRSQPPR